MSSWAAFVALGNKSGRAIGLLQALKLLPSVQLQPSCEFAAKAAPKKGSAKGAKGQKAGPKGGTKTPKQKGGSKGGSESFGEQTLKLVKLLSPVEPQPLSSTPAEMEDSEQRAKRYARLKLDEHGKWQQDLKTKVRLKHAALAALPEDLRKEAEKEDLEPFPVSRNMYFATPPEQYRD